MAYSCRSKWVQEVLIPRLVTSSFPPGSSLANLEVADKKGGNAVDGGFASGTYKLHLIVNLQGNVQESYHLIAKVSPEEAILRTVHNSDAQFYNEAWWYDNIVPALLGRSGTIAGETRLQPDSCNEEAEKLGLKLWPRCWLNLRESDELAAVVMQDLAADGFRLGVPAAELNYAHAKLSLERLGIFHGFGYALRHRNPLLYKRIVEGIKETKHNDDQQMDPMLRLTVERGVGPLRLKPECSEFVAALDRAFGVSPDALMAKFARPSKAEVTNILCHGDFCRNNVLFQYQGDDNTPCDARFIDFATVREATPAIDLSFFLYLSVSPEARAGTKLRSLLTSYHDALVSTLERLQGGPDPWGGDVGLVEQELGRCALYGYAICSFFLPVMGTEGGFQIEEAFQMSEEERNAMNVSLGGQEMTDKLVDILLEFQERGFHKLWTDDDKK